MKMALKSLTEFKREQFKDPKVKKAYDQLEPEFLLIQCLIEERLKSGLTQSELAKKLRTKQSAISRFEAGKSNPTMSFLFKLADALNVRLKMTVDRGN